MNPHRVRIDTDAHGVAVVSMVRTDKMNALDAAMFDALAEAIASLRDNARVRAVVLHGEGRAFSAGIDKASLGGDGDGSLGDLVPRTHGVANRWQHVAWGWRELPVPVIAAVHGVAFGGGLQIALGADIRYVHPDTQLSVMEVKWGLVPDMAGCMLLAELVRPDVARDLVFSGRIINAAEALGLGLVTRVEADTLPQALALARQISVSSPDAIRASKRLLNTAASGTAAQVLQMEAFEQQRLLGSENHQEAVRAGGEQREPVFR